MKGFVNFVVYPIENPGRESELPCRCREYRKDVRLPKSDFAMHQLRSSKVNDVMPYLDSERFAEVVNGHLNEMEDSE